ncbi:MAG: hypothetical protein WBI44_03445 [Syntrophaceticus sp.]
MHRSVSPELYNYHLIKRAMDCLSPLKSKLYGSHHNQEYNYNFRQLVSIQLFECFQSGQQDHHEDYTGDDRVLKSYQGDIAFDDMLH